jgi:transposase
MTVAELEARRLSAIPLFESGMKAGTIARKLKVARTTALRWRDNWKIGSNLKARKKTGRPSLLTTPQKQLILIEFENGGSVIQISTFIESRFGIRYDDAHLGRQLKKWGVPVRRRSGSLASSVGAIAQTEVRG